MTSKRWPAAFFAIVLATDLALINGSFVGTSLFKFGSIYPEELGLIPIYLRFQLFLNLVLPLCLVLTGAYRDLWRSPLGHQTMSALKGCLWAGAITAGAMFLVRDIGYSRVFVSFQIAQLAVVIPFSRILLMQVSELAHRRGYGLHSVIVAGEREPLRDLALFFRMAPHLGYRVAAILPVDFEPEEESVGEPRVLKDRGDLLDCLKQGGLERILICDRSADRSRWKTVIDLADELHVEVRLVRWPLLVPHVRTRIHDVLTVPVVPSDVQIALSVPGSIVKRAIDIFGSLAALVLLSPALLLISVAIRLDSRGPVFYRQQRLTKKGRVFDILKFRSMRTSAEEELESLSDENQATGPLFKLKNDPRVTRVGALLRRFSLDELPQFINVLRGDLSLVGPRPPLPEEAAQYEDWQRHRLDVVQGITGLWQVSGRSRLSFEEMALLDLYYIENRSTLLDIEILLETLPTVLQGDGAY